jgi:prepilin-type N-terminal cleavage/methylation domain-containing protein
MKKVQNEKIRGMTMTEILTVLVIIGALAAIAYPTILKMRSWGRTVKCVAQLRDIGTALKLFQVDHGDYPPWLSNLSPNYLRQVDIGDSITKQKPLVCPNDYADPQGSQGRLSTTIKGLDPYPELNDTEVSSGGGQPVYVGKGRWTQDQPKSASAAIRNHDVRYCSYSYEFALPECSYWKGELYPDQLGNRDGVVSWREVKTIAESQGIIDAQGNIDPAKAFDGKVPIVRCFWHIAPDSMVSLIRSDPRNVVWNLRSGDMSVSRSDPTQEGWQKD